MKTLQNDTLKAMYLNLKCSFLKSKRRTQDYMKIKQALKLFHGQENYNCAQAIFKTFQNEFNTPEYVINDARRKGGGRAENGYCGALYAGQQLLIGKPQLKKLYSAFEQKGGSRRCREIKMAGKLSCKKCVVLAASVVEESLP